VTVLENEIGVLLFPEKHIKNAENPWQKSPLCDASIDAFGKTRIVLSRNPLLKLRTEPARPRHHLSAGQPQISSRYPQLLARGL
jgi:hypothetical protein